MPPSMTDRLDDTVVAAFTAGSEKAFGEVYEHFYAELRVFAYQIVNDREEAKDIVISSFTKLFQRCAYFSTYVNIRAFLYVTTRNACFNHLKYVSRKLRRDKAFMAIQDDETSIDNAIFQSDLLKYIYTAVEQLPPRSREVFQMIFEQNLSPKQIAEKLNITVETVRSQKRYALNLLRDNLSQKQMAALLLCFAVSLF